MDSSLAPSDAYGEQDYVAYLHDRLAKNGRHIESLTARLAVAERLVRKLAWDEDPDREDDAALRRILAEPT